MKLVKKISIQTFWQVIGKTYSSLLTLLAFSLLARSFGPLGFGVYSLALTYLNFFYLAVDMGLNAYFLRQYQDRTLGLEWNKLLGLRLILGGGLILLSIAALPLFNLNQPDFVLLILVGSWSILASAVVVSCNAVFQSKLSYQYVSLATFFSSGAAYLVLAGLVLFRQEVYKMIWSPLLGLIVGAMASLFLVKKYIKNITPRFDLVFIKETAISGWPLALTLLVNTVYFRVDSFILSAQKGFIAVGIYNLPYQLFQTALVLPTFIMNSFYPVMITLFEDRQKFFKVFTQALGMLLLTGVLAVVASILVGPVFIKLVAGGKSFSGSSEVLNILSLSFPAFFGSSLGMWALVVMGRYKQLMWIYVMGLLLNILLNFLLIPFYSYLGAAMATVICEYLIFASQLIILYRKSS